MLLPMRIPRIYTSGNLHASQIVSIDAQAHKHVKDVLRLNVGDRVSLFNGDGYDYAGTITELNKKSTLIQLGKQSQTDTESPLHIHLLQPLCRSEKMDWCLQKATELGVSKITPFVSARVNIKLSGNRLNKKMEHWRSVINSACEQSGRAIIPQLSPPLSLEKAINDSPTDCIKVIATPTASQNELGTLDSNAEKCVCLIGPEGGFTEEETVNANLADFQSCLLGPRILRLETAVIATITLTQARWGDLN
jgi:16S rRNA (uracil1498-N3)-methyltransferase